MTNKSKTNIPDISDKEIQMANQTQIIPNAELFFAKLDPARPNASFNKENPTWEVQIRTRDKKVAKGWKDMNLRVQPKEDDEGLYYAANLKKKSMKRDGSPMAPVNVVAGDLSPVDPATIGNGSIANLSVYQYQYNVNGSEGIASMLMGVQITTLNEYTPRPKQGGFEITDFKVNKVSDNQEVDDDMLTSVEDDLDF